MIDVIATSPFFSATGSRTDMNDRGLTTWHFFRRTIESDLWCAVPAHQALPPFLMSGQWHFSGHRRGGDDAPPGFDDGAAAVADRFNGFYLFQLAGYPERNRPLAC